ncbi:Pentatricopeptide repeat-containing protein [Hirschfeldia incana]|nr:Pentatricopeptide repeat-containing protein [Hirschfeldia incana]
MIDNASALNRNIESVLAEMNVDLSRDTLLELLERFPKARTPAFRLLRLAAEKPRDSTTYNYMMAVLAKTRQMEIMVSLLKEMGAKGLLNMRTFTIAMKAFATAKDRKKAAGVFELMSKYKFEVGVKTVNPLLDSLGRGKRVVEAQLLFDKMKN